jgi:uncharacterized membrane protein
MDIVQQKSASQTVKINYYYLVTGILSILFSFTHAWNGQAAVLPKINSTGIDLTTKTTFFYVWHILTVENGVFGLALIAMAFFKDPSKTRFAAWMIAIIMIARWGVIFGSTLPNNANGLAGILVDLVVIIVYAGIIIAGTRQNRAKETAA